MSANISTTVQYRKAISVVLTTINVMNNFTRQNSHIVSAITYFCFINPVKNTSRYLLTAGNQHTLCHAFGRYIFTVSVLVSSSNVYYHQILHYCWNLHCFGIHCYINRDQCKLDCAISSHTFVMRNLQ